VNVEAPTRDGSRPLHMAALGGLPAEAALLLERRAEVDQVRPVDGCSALHLAAQQGSNAMAELLLQARADPSLRNLAARTPLEVAMQNGFEQLGRLLSARAGSTTTTTTATARGVNAEV
ncbi:unnamed protein product, partial [Polarella glacialis]